MTDDIRNARSRLKIAPTKDLRKYTQQIWLAGLGAFSRAEEEGGKLFDNLVKVGEDLEIVGLVISGHITGMYIASPLVGIAADRIGRRPVILMGALLANVNIFSLLLWQHPTFSKIPVIGKAWWIGLRASCG